jgi:hypothetical protein
LLNNSREKNYSQIASRKWGGYICIEEEAGGGGGVWTEMKG